MAGAELAFAPITEETLFWTALAKHQSVEAVLTETEYGENFEEHDICKCCEMVHKGVEMGMIKRMHLHLLLKDPQDPNLEKEIRETE